MLPSPLAMKGGCAELPALTSVLITYFKSLGFYQSPVMPPLDATTHFSIHGSSFTEIHGDANYQALGPLNLHVPRPYESGQPRIPVIFL